MARPLTPFAEWPPHVRTIFEAVGRVMTTPRLYPETLELLPPDAGEILPGHEVHVVHISGKQLGGRKGLYEITVVGHLYEGRWRFSSGELEKLANEAWTAAKGLGRALQ